MTEKYAFIRDEEGNHDIRKMCRWADVSRSGYLDWRDREPSRTAMKPGTVHRTPRHQAENAQVARQTRSPRRLATNAAPTRLPDPGH